MRSGGIRCEYATVLTTTLGTPSGNAAATSSARSVPMLPPSINTPWMRPSRQAARVRAAAPRAIAVIAVLAGDRPGSCMIPVPRRIFLVWAAIHASGTTASEPHASAVHTEA